MARASGLQISIHLNLRTACTTFSDKEQRTITSRSTSQPRKTYLQSIQNTKLFLCMLYYTVNMIAGIAYFMIVCSQLLQFHSGCFRCSFDYLGPASRLRVERRALKAIDLLIKASSPQKVFIVPFLMNFPISGGKGAQQANKEAEKGGYVR